MCKLQEKAAKDNANGYYAGRLLADTLPRIAYLDGLDAFAASNRLRDAKAKSNRKLSEGNMTVDVI